MRISGPIAATLVIVACGSDDGGTPPQPQPASMEVTIAPATTMTSIGDTRSAAAVVRDANGAVIQGSSAAWTSSNTAVATVSPASGAGTTVTAVANGTATITGRAGNATDGEGVTVAQAFASLAVTATATTINKTAPGNTAQLTATPKDARNNNIAGLPAATFTSGNQSAATVNATGLVTAVDIGTAIITASLTAGAVTQTGTLTITVQANPAAQNVSVAAAGVTFDPVSVTLRVGDRVTWNFSGSHTVTFNAGPTPPANIGTLASPQTGGSVPRDFTAAGTYTYHCELHGTATSGMRGTVVVNP